MPPPLNRFPGGPNTLSPYHQQFPSHAQHSTSHPPPPGGTPAYLNAQIGQANPFSANSNLLGLAGGLNAGAGFNVGADTGLASHAARMGFAHAGNMQQQQQQPQHQSLQQQQSQHAQQSQSMQHAQHAQQQAHGLAEHATRAAQNKGRIREVWKHNLHEEMATLRELIERYPYIAMVGLLRPRCASTSSSGS